MERQVETIRATAGRGVTPKNALVIGASTGYGLASRIALGWGDRARTLGVFFEREPEANRTATAGYYNTVAFHEFARRDAIFAESLNGDAFSHELKRRAIEVIRKEMGPLDFVIYSLASPRRTHPDSGQVQNSVLKPIGRAYTNKTIDLGSEKVVDVTIEPATEQEIAETVAVMGGDDWRRWVTGLQEEGLLAQGARTLAYSYIGPELTWPIYRDGSIGRAKLDLDATAKELDGMLASKLGGHAWISVNKAVVTQASAAIPVVPLYMSLLMKVMSGRGLDEMPIEQMQRLFGKYLATGKGAALDAEKRIRLDDREMQPEIQRAVSALWPRVTTENLRELSDFAGFQRQFHNLFGFDVEGVNYDEAVEIEISW